jgi:hypothetical protein
VSVGISGCSGGCDRCECAPERARSEIAHLSGFRADPCLQPVVGKKDAVLVSQVHLNSQQLVGLPGRVPPAG